VQQAVALVHTKLEIGYRFRHTDMVCGKIMELPFPLHANRGHFVAVKSVESLPLPKSL
jgi:hypothetical protein